MKSSLLNSFYSKTILSIATLAGTIALTFQPFIKPILAQAGNIKVHNYYTYPPFEEIYYYAVETENGLILIDTGRLLSQARYALEDLEQFDKPILAILITHPHTDHFGGLPAFIEAAGEDIAIYASKITLDSIDNDEQGYIENRSQQLGRDFPDAKEIPLPNAIVQDGETFTIDGVDLVAYDFPSNEAETTTTYYFPEKEIMFVGDLVNGEKTPGLFEGNTNNWLNTLRTIQQEFPELDRLYPSHTEPDRPDKLIEAQIDYIETFRSLVSQALENDELVDENERRDLINEIEEIYPDYETSLLLPGLIEINIDGVAEELQNEGK